MLDVILLKMLLISIKFHLSMFSFLWFLCSCFTSFQFLLQSVGGIIGPRVADISPDSLGGLGQEYTTQRERVIIKSDVWRSRDGANW